MPDHPKVADLRSVLFDVVSAVFDAEDLDELRARVNEINNRPLDPIEGGGVSDQREAVRFVVRKGGPGYEWLPAYCIVDTERQVRVGAHNDEDAAKKHCDELNAEVAESAATPYSLRERSDRLEAALRRIAEGEITRAGLARNDQGPDRLLPLDALTSQCIAERTLEELGRVPRTEEEPGEER